MQFSSRLQFTRGMLLSLLPQVPCPQQSDAATPATAATSTMMKLDDGVSSSTPYHLPPPQFTVSMDTVISKMNSEYHFVEDDTTSSADPPSCYSDNWTVFGQILRRELPANVLYESKRVLAFEDIKPRAPLHCLVIPKRFIGSVFDLNASNDDAFDDENDNDDIDDLTLLLEMKQVALKVLQEYQPEAYQQQDYRLCFHLPPFNTVDHLHLHVLAPLSEMGVFYRNVKYNPHTRWCVDLEQVVQRLQQGQPAVPYHRPSRPRGAPRASTTPAVAVVKDRND